MEFDHEGAVKLGSDVGGQALVDAEDRGDSTVDEEGVGDEVVKFGVMTTLCRVLARIHASTE
jgi:hypothetical protein